MVKLRMKVIRSAAPVREQTAKIIKEAIVQGRFKPGERLLEKKLCELIEVSRTSVREALRQLETEGFIKLIPNKGPQVATVSVEEAKDIYQVRQMLESLACKFFVQKASDFQVKNLSKVVKRLENACLKRDLQKFIEINDDFYSILLEGCGNRLIQSIIKSINARIFFLRKISLSIPGRPTKCVEEMKHLMKAIEQRDLNAAWEACFKHLNNVQAVAIDALHGYLNKNSEQVIK